MSRIVSHEELLDIGDRLMQAVSTFRGTNLSVNFKSENDAVSDFDFFLERKLIDELSFLDPGVPILSEEKINIYGSDSAWIVDPLDGTSNYIQGLSPSAIVAAKVVGTDVLASIIVDISSGDIYTAIKEGGARLNGNPLIFKSPVIKLVGVSTGYLKHGGQIPEQWNARILGSQALHLCMVARGIFSSCVNYEAKAWDDVAGCLIVSESGGTYRNQFPDTNWVKLAVDGSSLGSVAALNSVDFETIHTLVMESNYG